MPKTSKAKREDDPIREGVWDRRENVITLTTPQGRCHPMSRGTAEHRLASLQLLSPGATGPYRTTEELEQAKRCLEEGLSLFG